MQLLIRPIAALAATVAILAPAAHAAPLKVGSPAPALKLSKWVKGTPITLRFKYSGVLDGPAGGPLLNKRLAFIGENNGSSISAADIAEEIGSIGYEITCGISSRVPRVFEEKL